MEWMVLLSRRLLLNLLHYTVFCLGQTEDICRERIFVKPRTYEILGYFVKN